MSIEIKRFVKKTFSDLHLPRYAEIPTVGLYLDQVTKYINEYLIRIGCAEITGSMISNYVKKGFIPAPHKKQYYADQIAYLIFIAVSKNVLSLENIVVLFEIQRDKYTIPVAYDYFCDEFENMLTFVFGLKSAPDEKLGSTESEEKDFLRQIIISLSHSIYLTACFSGMKKQKEDALSEN